MTYGELCSSLYGQLTMAFYSNEEAKSGIYFALSARFKEAQVFDMWRGTPQK